MPIKGLREQYGTTTPKLNKYMFDANQSLRISFEELVGRSTWFYTQRNCTGKNKIFEGMTTIEEESSQV